MVRVVWLSIVHFSLSVRCLTFNGAFFSWNSWFGFQWNILLMEFVIWLVFFERGACIDLNRSSRPQISNVLCLVVCFECFVENFSNDFHNIGILASYRASPDLIMPISCGDLHACEILHLLYTFSRTR